MYQLKRFAFILPLVLLLAACGSSDKKIKATISEKRAELEKKKKEQTTLASEIQALEEELARIDTASSKQLNAKLVSVSTLGFQPFNHFIEIQGRVTSDNISVITPRLGPGQVKAVYVTQGQPVRKGQLLLKLDDAVIRQQVAAARAGLGTLQAQLATARDIYNRQNNLWKQGIGTEVQLIQARTNVTTLETQLNAARENIKTAEEQLKATNVYSDVSGIAEQVNVRVGETFMGMIGAVPQIQIVNNSVLKAVAAVPETYASRVKLGSPVTVVLPDINRTYNSKISVAGRVIDPNSRSFNIEAKIPSDGAARPNQVARIQIQDYAIAKTIVVPVNTIQTDENGKYVFVAVQEGGRTVARKKPVGVGELNGQMIEVKVGLNEGDQLITDGFQNLYEGQVISIVK